jgi:hypothetical protein
VTLQHYATVCVVLRALQLCSAEQNYLLQLGTCTRTVWSYAVHFYGIVVRHSCTEASITVYASKGDHY